MVASLPQHAHLFAEHGCLRDRNDKNVDCSDEQLARRGNVTPLPEGFKPLTIHPEMNDAWIQLLRDKNIIVKKQSG